MTSPGKTAILSSCKTVTLVVPASVIINDILKNCTSQLPQTHPLIKTGYIACASNIVDVWSKQHKLYVKQN